MNRQIKRQKERWTEEADGHPDTPNHNPLKKISSEEKWIQKKDEVWWKDRRRTYISHSLKTFAFSIFFFILSLMFTEGKQIIMNDVFEKFTRTYVGNEMN